MDVNLRIMRNGNRTSRDGARVCYSLVVSAMLLLILCPVLGDEPATPEAEAPPAQLSTALERFVESRLGVWRQRTYEHYDVKKLQLGRETSDRETVGATVAESLGVHKDIPDDWMYVCEGLMTVAGFPTRGLEFVTVRPADANTIGLVSRCVQIEGATLRLRVYVFTSFRDWCKEGNRRARALRLDTLRQDMADAGIEMPETVWQAAREWALSLSDLDFELETMLLNGPVSTPTSIEEALRTCILLERHPCRAGDPSLGQSFSMRVSNRDVDVVAHLNGRPDSADYASITVFSGGLSAYNVSVFKTGTGAAAAADFKRAVLAAILEGVMARPAMCF